MKRCIALTMLAGLFAVSSIALGQQAVTIKMKHAAAGEVTVIAKDEKSTAVVKVTDKDGKVLKEDNKASTEITEYEETVVKREEGKRPTKLEREYVKWTVKEDDTTEEVLAKGKKIVIEKKDGKFAVAHKDGTKVGGSAERKLLKEFDEKKEDNDQIERLFLPSTPVKPGESWKLDAAKIAKEMAKSSGMTADPAKAIGTGKLLNVYTKDGKQFGKITVDLKLPITEMTPLKFADGAVMHLDLVFDGCIDGTSEAGVMTKKITFSGSSTIPNLPGAAVTMNITSDGVMTQRDVPNSKK